jgi:hypothetical protein
MENRLVLDSDDLQAIEGRIALRVFVYLTLGLLNLRYR